MNEKLILSLIDKGVIKPKTFLTAALSTIDFAGQRHTMIKDFSLRRVVSTEKGIFFAASLTSEPDGAIYKVPLASIRTIDGMDIKSIAKVFGLKPDGTVYEAKICPITGEPLRRGRKPKWVKERMAQMAANEDFDLDEEEEEETIHA